MRRSSKLGFARSSWSSKFEVTVRIRRRRSGRWLRETWRANRRQAAKDAWRLHVVTLAVIVGCGAGIVLADGFSDLILAAVIGSLLTIEAVFWTLGGHVDQLRLIRGIWGEESTEDELDKLKRAERGWEVEHDIPGKKGNWDHVVVSRAGIFAIESKWTSWPASVESNVLRLGNVPYRASLFSHAAAELHDAVAVSTERVPWVTAVVVIWGRFDQGLVELDHVAFVSGGRLVEWLLGQPPRLNEQRAEATAKAVRDFAKAAIADEKARSRGKV
jgi:hypothetical protein